MTERSRRLVEPSGPQEVVAHLRELARGRRGRKVNKAIAYLDGHLAHMRYAHWREQKVPIGSGIVESAVLKSGHWDDLIPAVLSRRHWLQPAPADSHQEQTTLQEAA